MKRLKRRLLSRRVVLTQILLLLGAILTAYVTPQRFTTNPQDLLQWRESRAAWAAWAEKLGLDHLYTTWWFAFLLLVFMITLIISTVEQVQRSRRLTFGAGGRTARKSLRIAISVEEVLESLRKAGYRKIYEEKTRSRFVKHPWGYWGNVLLHLGMVIVITASLLLVVTETRGLLHLQAGERHDPGDPWVVEEPGMLAARFLLPEAVRLDEVIPEYWETDDVKQMSTVFSFIDAGGRETRHTLAINQTVNDRGLRIYQGRTYGDGFYVTLRKGKGEEHNMLLQIEHPENRDRPSYSNFHTEGVPYMIKAKYFADAEKKTVATVNPVLYLRLVEEWGEVLDEIALKKGEKEAFGPYEAELVEVTPWSGIIFVRSYGMSGIFAGFIVIILGVSLTYFMPPREIVVTKGEEGFLVGWRAFRFEKFYEEEFRSISTLLGGHGV